MNSRIFGAVIFLTLPLACGAQGTIATSGVSDQSPLSSQPVPATQPQSGEIAGGGLIHREDPKYPKEARKRKLQGQVVVQVTIEENGTVTIISLLSGEPTLANAAREVVHQWKFEPFTLNGRPVRVQQKLVFNFAPTSKVGELQFPLPEPKAMSLFVGPGVYRVGGAVSPPRVLYSPDPEYSDEARKAKYQGVCVLTLIVGSDGLPRDIKVVRSLGMGLDEKAIDAVGKWKFQPSELHGKPVAVAINVEVNFRL